MEFFELNMSTMKRMFKLADKMGAKFMAIAVTVPGSEHPEVIINPMAGRKAKMKYYQEAYNEDLTHKNAPLRILNYTYGESLQQIEQDFTYLFK